MALIDEFLVGLGFEFDEKELDNFQKSVDKTKQTLGALIKTTVAVTAAVGAFLKTSATATDEVTKQARQVRTLTGEYDALLHASEITVGSSQAMAGAMQSLAVRASEAARGAGSGVEAFGMLGISVTDANGEIKNTDILLSETADALNNLGDQGQRLELADKLGLREVDLLLREGSEGIRELTDEAKALGVITEADAKAAEDFNDSQSRMFRILNTVRRTIATGLLPQVQKIMDSFTEWLKINKDIIKQKFNVFVKVLGKVLSLLGNILGIVIDLIGRFINALGGLENAFKFLLIVITAVMGAKMVMMFLNFIKLIKTAGTAALVMNAKMLLIPILIGAAIAVLGLLINDIMTFIEGGDSLFGRMLKEFPIINKAFETLRDILSEVWNFVEMIGKGIGEFAGAAITNITEFTNDPLGATGDFLSSMNPFSNEPPSSAGATTNNSGGNVTQTNTFQITSNNPEEVGEAVRKVVEDMAGNGIRNTASAVDF